MNVCSRAAGSVCLVMTIAASIAATGAESAAVPKAMTFEMERASGGKIRLGEFSGRVVLVKTSDIDWIEAAGVYVTLHIGDGEFLYRAGLAEVASRLDPLQFVRIHRSSVVNLRSIAVLERRTHGEFEVVLKSGARLMLSRSYREQVETLLGQSL